MHEAAKQKRPTSPAHPFNILYETWLYRGNAILEILYSRLKNFVETAEYGSRKNVWFRAELNFCPKIVSGSPDQ